MDTEEMIRHWLEVLVERKVMPPAGAAGAR